MTKYSEIMYENEGITGVPMTKYSEIMYENEG